MIHSPRNTSNRWLTRRLPLLVSALFFLLMPISGSAQTTVSEEQKAGGTQDSGAAVAGTTLDTTRDTAADNVEDSVDEPTEVVVIDGTEYPVPPPWIGNRIDAPVLNFDSFRKIPVAYTLNSSSLYILAEAHPHLVGLLQKAEEDGIALKIESSYRSENYQRKIFRRMLGEGRTFDDIVRYVAPPGYSMHMLGIAVDFSPSNWRFAGTPQYTWLQENAHLYGFEETYSQYNRLKMPWEAWHWSYTGTKTELRVNRMVTEPGTLNP